MKKISLCALMLTVLSLALGVGPALADVWQALRQGGNVVLMRHGTVDNLSKSTSPDADFEGCEGQFNLNELGRAQALLLGEVLRKQQVPVGGVLASPLCRTRDTARIAFGGFRVWPELEPFPEEAVARNKVTEDISRVIAEFRGKDNLFLVTHQPNIDAIAFESVEPATLVVVRPDGRGGFQVLGVLRPEEWSRVSKRR